MPSTAAQGLKGGALVLNVAGDLLSSTPITSQILRCAAHISELAETIQKKREAMYSLIEKATIYAKQIDTVVAGSTITVDDAHQHRLERLFVVFRKIEALVAKEAKKSLKRSLWNVLVAPGLAEQLAEDLAQEIQLFQLLTCIDMRLSSVDSSRYVGEFRRLRHSDVRKLEMIAQRTLATGVISWTSARVDGEVMVVRYIEAGSSQHSPEDNSLWCNYTEVIRGLSTVHASHPHVVQLYGLRTGPPEVCFSAFRAGTHDVFDFLRRSAENDEGVRACRCLLTSYKILDASWYLKHVHNLAWIPGNALPDNARVVTVDDVGEPQIGLFDDIVDGQEWERGIKDNLNCHWKILKKAWSTGGDTVETGPVEQCHNGCLQEVVSPMLPMADGKLKELWAVICNASSLSVRRVVRSTPLLQTRTPLSATTLVRARDYFSELCAAAGNTIQWNSWLDLAIMQEPSQPLAPIENCIYFSNIDAIRFVRCTGKDGWLRREHFDVCLPRGSLLDTETRRILGLTSEFEGQHIVYAAKGL